MAGLATSSSCSRTNRSFATAERHVEFGVRKGRRLADVRPAAERQFEVSRRSGSTTACTPADKRRL